MINIISNIFKSSGYLGSRFKPGILFDKKDESKKKDFWIVIETDKIESVNNIQPTVFKECQDVSNDICLNKNISMLVLWETDGTLEFDELKRKIMPIEEDAFFFKKQVLYFSKKELDLLREATGTEDIFDFITNNITDEDNFLKYKEDKLSQTWQTLLYRIAIKIPFLRISTTIADDLKSLQEDNIDSIRKGRDKSLLNFNNRLFEMIEGGDLKDIDTINTASLFIKLKPLIADESNGD